jgi:hypothetical protein
MNRAAAFRFWDFGFRIWDCSLGQGPIPLARTLVETYSLTEKVQTKFADLVGIADFAKSRVFALTS